MQKSGTLYHQMQSKSRQCPADSDEEHLEGFKAGDEEAALPASARPEEQNEGSQIVSSEFFMLVGWI